MSILEKITADLTNGLKEKDEVRVSTLRFLISALKNAQIAKGSELTDDEILTEIQKDAKRHTESITSFESAGRTDLAEKEKKELEILKQYLPEQLTDSELETMVGEAISAVDAKTISDMGRVVKAVLSSAGAIADGAKVAEIAKRKLTTAS